MGAQSNNLGPNKSFYRGGLIDISPFSLDVALLDSRWDDFISKSPESSIFVHSVFLNASGENNQLFWCFKNQQPVAAIVITLDHLTAYPTLDTPIVYNGIFTAPPRYGQNLAQVRSDRFALFCFLSNELSGRFPKLKLRFAPEINDIRPFLWHNYDKIGPKYKVDIRYTSILCLEDLSSCANEESSILYSGMSSSRRQELRYARKKKYTTREFYDLSLFRQLLLETFDRQNTKQTFREFEQYQRITQALRANKMLRAYCCGQSHGETDSMALFAVLGSRAYYIYGCGRKDREKSHAGTAVMWDAFIDLSRSGINFIDLEGVNSPTRGYFKLSFGGTLQAYYSLELQE
jgi:hypothetical protein